MLELPIHEATHAIVGRVAARAISVASLGAGGLSARTYRLTLDELAGLVAAPDYTAAVEYFRRDPEAAWAGYVLGAFVVLARERGVRFDSGARILVVSDVPEGKGVSSSAAVEVASMAAVAAAFDVEVRPRDLAILCQMVENLVVGAPCGVMDQMTAAVGESDRLLALRCQPAELEGSVAVPPGIAFWGIDSGVRHSVVGEDYGTVRTAAFMGYRVIADLAGLPVQRDAGTKVRIQDFRWGGYLANMTPDEFRSRFESLVPASLSGKDFLERYDGTTDSVTCVVPDRTYPVRAATRHPILENARVDRFRKILEGDAPLEHLEALGALMYASHASYSSCGLGSEATDLLVEMVRSAGPDGGLYGAKITGGGSGGTVAVLGRSDASDSIAAIAREYHERTGREPYVFSGSSEGAAAFGTQRTMREGGVGK